MNALKKTSRKEIFINFLNEVQSMAIRKHLYMNFMDMPGTKRELLAVARKRHEELATTSEASFEEYMKSCECKFRSGSSRTADKHFYENLFR